VATYAMRARNAANSAYVSWTSATDDFTGVDAPEAILGGSAVALPPWDVDQVIQERLDEVPYLQSTNVAVTSDDPGIGHNTVFVNTAHASWNDADAIALPASPQVGCRVTVKDSAGNANVKSITVNGNGNTVDGSATHPVNLPYAAVSVIYNGTEWKVT